MSGSPGSFFTASDRVHQYLMATHTVHEGPQCVHVACIARAQHSEDAVYGHTEEQAPVAK